MNVDGACRLISIDRLAEVKKCALFPVGDTPLKLTGR